MLKKIKNKEQEQVISSLITFNKLIVLYDGGQIFIIQLFQIQKYDSLSYIPIKENMEIYLGVLTWFNFE